MGSPSQTSEIVKATIPIGDTDALDAVLIATTAVTAAATLLILSKLLRKEHKQRNTQ